MDRRPDRLLRIAEVTHIVGLSTTTVYALIGQGRFPKQVAINGMARWSYRETIQWVHDRKAERDQPIAKGA